MFSVYSGVPKVSMLLKTNINPTLNNLSNDLRDSRLALRSALSLFFGLGWAFLSNGSDFLRRVGTLLPVLFVLIFYQRFLCLSERMWWENSEIQSQEEGASRKETD